MRLNVDAGEFNQYLEKKLPPPAYKWKFDEDNDNYYARAISPIGLDGEDGWYIVVDYTITESGSVWTVSYSRTQRRKGTGNSLSEALHSLLYKSRSQYDLR